ncbi:hypothetical protein B0H14DRAFT_2592816 [Mycena olivaceomarginata]|nr:hypothetical protein B0H14DRAFT_2592816 [Mycena olivaceomarginata]
MYLQLKLPGHFVSNYIDDRTCDDSSLMASLSNDLCSCGGYFTSPRVCEGYHTPGANNGRFYQKCQYNNFQKDSSNPCTGFKWRDDIPRRMAPLPPPNLSPTQRVDHTPFPFPFFPIPSDRLADAGQHFSQSSTPYTQTALYQLHLLTKKQAGWLPSCQVSVALLQDVLSERWRTTPLNSFTLVANQPRLPDPLSGISADTTAPAEIPLVYETSKAKRIDVSYVQKVLDGQHELPLVNRFQREVYRKSEAQSLKIRLWFEDGKPSQTLAVSNPAAPWFHPKDSEPITRLVSAACTSYYYWDSGDHTWILTDTAVKVRPNTDILFLRLENVVDCLDGPHAKNKRRLSDNSSQSQTPKSNRHKDASQRPNITPLSYGAPSYGASSYDAPSYGAPLSYRAAPDRQGSIVVLSSSDEEEDEEEEEADNVHKLPARFVKAFQVDWSLDPHVLEYAVQCGRGYGGNWKALMKGKGKA